MVVWSFIFTKPSHRYTSARVAAPTRVDACALLSSVIEMDISPARELGRDTGGIIIQSCGLHNVPAPRVLSLTERAIAI